MIFTKNDASKNGVQVKDLMRKYNVHYRACIGALIYLTATRVNISFPVSKLAKFSANPGKIISRRWYIFYGTCKTIRTWD